MKCILIKYLIKFEILNMIILVLKGTYTWKDYYISIFKHLTNKMNSTFEQQIIYITEYPPCNKLKNVRWLGEMLGYLSKYHENVTEWESLLRFLVSFAGAHVCPRGSISVYKKLANPGVNPICSQNAT